MFSIQQQQQFHYYLLSSSTISTVTWAGSPIAYLLAGEGGMILRLKVSLPSSVSSSFIITLNVALMLPAENGMLYGPES